MKNLNKVIWGALLVVLGAILALNAFDIADIDLFFDGWWTLFIIIPSLVALFSERDKLGSIIALCIGVVLFLCEREILDYSMMWKLAAPAIIVIIGVKLILSSFIKKEKEKNGDSLREGKNIHECCATFSGRDEKLYGERFEGAELTAVFGGIEYDLRGAIIEEDCEIKVCAVFGGVDILVPEGVRIKVDTLGIFGGTSNKTPPLAEGVTVYVTGACIFGGAEIK